MECLYLGHWALRVSYIFVSFLLLVEPHANALGWNIRFWVFVQVLWKRVPYTFICWSFLALLLTQEYKTVIRYQFVNICPQYPCILLDSPKGLPCSMYPFKLLHVVLPRYFILFYFSLRLILRFIVTSYCFPDEIVLFTGLACWIYNL